MKFESNIILEGYPRLQQPLVGCEGTLYILLRLPGWKKIGFSLLILIWWPQNCCKSGVSLSTGWSLLWRHIDGLVQERRNSSALAMELHLSSTNPLTWALVSQIINNSAVCLTVYSGFQQRMHQSSEGPLCGESTSDHWWQSDAWCSLTIRCLCDFSTGPNFSFATKSCDMKLIFPGNITNLHCSTIPCDAYPYTWN